MIIPHKKLRIKQKDDKMLVFFSSCFPSPSSQPASISSLSFNRGRRWSVTVNRSDRKTWRLVLRRKGGKGLQNLSVSQGSGVLFSHVQLCDPRHYSPPGSSVHGILQQEYWSELSWPTPGHLPRDQTQLSVSPTLATGCFTTRATWNPQKP